MRLHPLAIAVPVLAVVAALGSGPASADLVPRQSATNPTNLCQSALPVFDGNIRKRPLAVQNEGTGNAFVTCSFPSGEGRVSTSSNATQVYLYAQSIDGVAHSLSCTGVSGNAGSVNVFITKSVNLAANGDQGNLVWRAADFPGSPTYFPGNGLFSVSCNLAPGVGLNDSYVSSYTEIGA